MKKLEIWPWGIPYKHVALKLDGFQATLNERGQVVSRAGKPLYNVDPALLEPGKKYEIYIGSFKFTDQVLSTKNHGYKVKKQDLYEIWPGTDPRLEVPESNYPYHMPLIHIFERALADGYEGLVIDKRYKLKPKETYDVPIIDIEYSTKGQYKGGVAALVTPMGKVGTGLTKAQRMHTKWKLGEIIEVECMMLTENGKFRHGRFVRRRWDKLA